MSEAINTQRVGGGGIHDIIIRDYTSHEEARAAKNAMRRAGRWAWLSMIEGVRPSQTRRVCERVDAGEIDL